MPKEEKIEPQIEKTKEEYKLDNLKFELIKDIIEIWKKDDSDDEYWLCFSKGTPEDIRKLALRLIKIADWAKDKLIT